MAAVAVIQLRWLRGGLSGAGPGLGYRSWFPNGYNSTEVLAALVEVFEQIPSHLRLSLTLDQGSEWTQWETLTATYGLDVWFCDPHAPWQRGAIECFNGDVRFWFPKGTRLDNVGVE